MQKKSKNLKSSPLNRTSKAVSNAENLVELEAETARLAQRANSLSLSDREQWAREARAHLEKARSLFAQSTNLKSFPPTDNKSHRLSRTAILLRLHTEAMQCLKSAEECARKAKA